MAGVGRGIRNNPALDAGMVSSGHPKMGEKSERMPSTLRKDSWDRLKAACLWEEYDISAQKTVIILRVTACWAGQMVLV